MGTPERIQRIRIRAAIVFGVLAFLAMVATPLGDFFNEWQAERSDGSYLPALSVMLCAITLSPLFLLLYLPFESVLRRSERSEGPKDPRSKK